MMLWMKDQTGFLSSYPFGAFAFADLTARIEGPDDPLAKLKDIRAPHIEYFNSECYLEPPHIGRSPPVQGDSAFAMITQLFNPQSRGTVELKSSDPSDKPVVQHNYLNDPLDAATLAEGCRLGNEIVLEGEGTKDIVSGSWPSTLTHHEHTTRAQWIDFVRDHTSTCKSCFHCAFRTNRALRLSSWWHLQDGSRRR